MLALLRELQKGSLIEMKLWVDDVRPAPEGYDVWCKSVNEAIELIIAIENSSRTIQLLRSIKPLDELEKQIIKKYTVELIDIDHDAGVYVNDGGDYIKLLDWLEEFGYDYPIRIHSMNSVGVENMRRIIQRNGWTEVK